jgi:hypothetical protein
LAAAAAIVTVPLVATQAVAQAPVRFGWVQYDSPGTDDGSNASLNEEWVRINNHGTRARILTDWTVHDLQGHVFTFPSFKLGPGHTVRIHTGSGIDTRTNLYWGRGWYVWNNTGDRAALRTQNGRLVDTCSWGDGSGIIFCG